MELSLDPVLHDRLRQISADLDLPVEVTARILLESSLVMEATRS